MSGLRGRTGMNKGRCLRANMNFSRWRERQKVLAAADGSREMQNGNQPLGLATECPWFALIRGSRGVLTAET